MSCSHVIHLASQFISLSHLNLHAYLRGILIPHHVLHSHPSPLSLSINTHTTKPSSQNPLKQTQRRRERKRIFLVLSSYAFVSMASSDKSPSPMPTGSDPRLPGQPMTMGQHMIDKGAQILQSLKPVKQMSQHVCTFALYSHDMTRQIETHHFITRVNQDFLQCAVYDTDHAQGRLIGETSIN